VEDNGGQRSARYDEVLRRYWPNVVRYLGRMLGWHHPDVEDLAQRTLETAWQKRCTAPPDGRVLPWLLSIAHNHLRNYRKHGDRRVVAAELPDGAWIGDGGMSAVERRFDLVRAWQTLNPREREVLSLAYLEDLTVAQIAQVTGRTEVAVRQRLSRGRHKLRQAIETMSDRQPTGRYGTR
jgi:RNA polymerase sigma-70 factor (ECF subfamily)